MWSAARLRGRPERFSELLLCLVPKAPRSIRRIPHTFLLPEGSASHKPRFAETEASFCHLRPGGLVFWGRLGLQKMSPGPVRGSGV